MASETIDLNQIALPSADAVELPEYWSTTRLPLPSLVFLLPLLLLYEWGVVVLSRAEPIAVRNGADIWMRTWLQSAGFGQTLLLPGIVVGVLLAWHMCGRYSWRISAETLMGMLAESLLFAFLLILAGQLQDLAFRRLSFATLDVSTLVVERVPVRVITFVGAGIYEEVLFRLCLLPACYCALRGMRCSVRAAAVLAVVCTGLVFAGAHYVGPHADAFDVFTFTFRATAGLFFAGLFYLRGFGITVGCHAAYDLLVGVILVA